MKFPSNLKKLALAALLAWIAPALGAASSSDLFSVVPAGDQAYTQLAQLEKTGLLLKGDSAKALTRFEVAERILRAQKKVDEIRVAQADDIPPPPADSDMTPPTFLAAPAAPAAAAPAQPSVAPEPLAPAVKVDLAEAEKNLHNLSEAYQFELKVVKDKVKAAEDRAVAVDASQFGLLQKLNGIEEYPTVAFHGLGRAFAFSKEYYGDTAGVSILGAPRRTTMGYLDLAPKGVISKQVRWNAILRFATNFEPDSSTDSMSFRRITMELNPEWFSATLGDFYESYTPFTVWNRNSLDLFYKPEMIVRKDREAKYESFFDQEPNWPFRGLRIGTDVAWVESDLLERFKASTFLHMFSNGFDADSKNASFFSPTTFTDWAWAGKATLKSKKWYVSNLSVQLSVDAQGVILDEPLYTNAPSAVYKSADPKTWAHQYLIGGWTPDFRMGFGGDFYFGVSMDLAFSSYQDDKLNNNRIISDYAATGGPYFQLGDSKVSFNFLDVGPYYYSPLAQARQDGITSYGGMIVADQGPELFQNPVQSRFFLTQIPSPDELFTFYDRTQDNTFPYGMGTPNRQGLGVDLDVKALDKQALKIKGSAYFVRELSGNLVPDYVQTGFTSVDAPAAVTVSGTYAPLSPAPVTITLVRDYTYINIGPSLNLGPLIGWDRDLEMGANVRYEQTNSQLGSLTGTSLLGGIKVGVMPSWDLSGSYGVRTASGTEVGYLGTLYARYPYIFESATINSDLGRYFLINVQGKVQSLKFSSAFKVNPNSRFFVDYDLTHGDLLPNGPRGSDVVNQFMELTYEIEF